MKEDINGAFGVQSENENANRRRVIGLCAKRELCVGNTHFKHN